MAKWTVTRTWVGIEADTYDQAIERSLAGDHDSMAAQVVEKDRTRTIKSSYPVLSRLGFEPGSLEPTSKPCDCIPGLFSGSRCPHGNGW